MGEDGEVAGTDIIPWRRHYIGPRPRKSQRTICEVLRELHEDATARGDAVSLARIDEAFDMAKRMARALEVRK